MGGSIARLILRRLPQGTGGPAADAEKPAKLIHALLHEASEVLRPVLDCLQGAMLNWVTNAVAPQFTAIRTIPALYRMLNKPVPSKPSPYVESAMRPISELKSSFGTQAVSSNML